MRRSTRGLLRRGLHESPPWRTIDRYSPSRIDSKDGTVDVDGLGRSFRAACFDPGRIRSVRTASSGSRPWTRSAVTIMAVPTTATAPPIPMAISGLPGRKGNQDGQTQPETDNDNARRKSRLLRAARRWRVCCVGGVELAGRHHAALDHRQPLAMRHFERLWCDVACADTQ